MSFRVNVEEHGALEVLGVVLIVGVANGTLLKFKLPGASRSW